jgi:NAD(P)-dependent dehydrogenase (short-subunit alcohol dehydrogenase family)
MPAQMATPAAARRLRGRVALITGAGSPRGIGRAIALGLGREGARVVAADVDGGLAEATAAAIRAAGGEAVGTRADVALAAEAQGLVDFTVAAFGRIDVVVNNAGIAPIRPFLELDEATWDRTFAVNVRSVYLVGQAAARRMIAQGGGGAIVNLSSISAEVSGGGLSHYGATKAAVSNLTRGMAAELGSHGIRVNAIGPGTIRTGIVDYLPAAERARRHEVSRRLTPLGRIGTPEDVVGAAVFLASDESGYVSGITLYVDGGQLHARVTAGPAGPATPGARPARRPGPARPSSGASTARARRRRGRGRR